MGTHSSKVGGVTLGIHGCVLEVETVRGDLMTAKAHRSSPSLVRLLLQVESDSELW